MDYWQPYIISLVIGLLVGIEREKAHPTDKTMGVRTFLLISLLGAIAGHLESLWLAGLLAVFSLALIAISYFLQSRESKADRGLTTEFAAGIIFCLGYIAHQHPTLAALIGPVVALILFSKPLLHRFSHAVKPSELETALLLVLLGVAVINLVPDKTVDPWQVFNPRKFGFIILTLAVLEFASYALAKMVGEKKGALIGGFLGGLVSSTAVLASSAKLAAQKSASWPALVAKSIAAKIAAFCELVFIVSLIAPSLLRHLALPLAIGVVVGGILIFIMHRKKENQDHKLELRYPLDWKGVFRLSVVLGVILAANSLLTKQLGDTGTYVVSFITGLFELHGVSLANATMFSQNQISENTATMGIFIAILASLIAKIVMAWIVEHGRFAAAITASFGLLALSIAAGIWFTPFV